MTKKANNRRPQTPKAPRMREFNQAMMEQGRSNATAPRAMATDYRRKPKHVKKGWE